VRDPGVMEALAGLASMAFDKTGTLTSGRPRVVGIDDDGVGADAALARTAGLERHSEHALAGAIAKAAAARGLQPVAASDIRIRPGRGIVGSVGGERAAAGNNGLMSELGWPLAPALRERAHALATGGHTVIYAGWGGRVHAVLSLDDSPLPEARATIEALRSRGLHLTLLTGDLAEAGRRIGNAVGLEEIQAGLSPEAKQGALRLLRESRGLVAMVGDGLNDGPVLAEADVGIAVGSATDLARETAALVLPPGGLWMLPWVIDVARAVRKTILSNLMWAFGYNLVALAAAAAGLLNPILAAAVMAGSSILVVVNSLRLERLPDPTLSMAPVRDTEAEGETPRRDIGIPWPARPAGAADPEIGAAA
jgi:Cu2+-exporting ATPase